MRVWAPWCLRACGGGRTLVDLFSIGFVKRRLIRIGLVGHHLVEQEGAIVLIEEIDDGIAIVGLP